jgi:AraC-like DNA-binding protein
VTPRSRRPTSASRSAVPSPAVVDRLAHLRAARDLLDRTYAGPVDLVAVAARAGYSRYHFTRAFKSAYGETPGRYLSRRRVERARTLLGAANLTVTEVCHLVGFSSLGSFSARFKELVGMAPSAYQRKVAGGGGPPAVPGCFLLMWSATGEKRTAPDTR